MAPLQQVVRKLGEPGTGAPGLWLQLKLSAGSQAPWMHCVPDPQDRPQPPQFEESVRRSTQLEAQQAPTEEKSVPAFTQANPSEAALQVGRAQLL
jgi:hypothetical protein